eukprot:m.41110 g.41110  ORF g.41110 m.41110 type:complete len:749 (-) comp6029_c0_seq4:1612-3858(-)
MDWWEDVVAGVDSGELDLAPTDDDNDQSDSCGPGVNPFLRGLSIRRRKNTIARRPAPALVPPPSSETPPPVPAPAGDDFFDDLLRSIEAPAEAPPAPAAGSPDAQDENEAEGLDSLGELDEDADVNPLLLAKPAASRLDSSSSPFSNEDETGDDGEVAAVVDVLSAFVASTSGAASTTPTTAPSAPAPTISVEECVSRVADLPEEAGASTRLNASVASGAISRKQAISAAWWVDKQLRTLIKAIKHHGKLNAAGKYEVRFGFLADKIGHLFEPFSGTLTTAKERGVVGYAVDLISESGEDDNVVVTLLSDKIDDADESTYTFAQVRRCSVRARTGTLSRTRSRKGTGVVRRRKPANASPAGSPARPTPASHLSPDRPPPSSVRVSSETSAATTTKASSSVLSAARAATQQLSAHLPTPQHRICSECNAAFGPTEQFMLQSSVFHRACLFCFVCRRKLTPTAALLVERDLVCDVHYQQALKRAGGSAIHAALVSSVEAIKRDSDAAAQRMYHEMAVRQHAEERTKQELADSGSAAAVSATSVGSGRLRARSMDKKMAAVERARALSVRKSSRAQGVVGVLSSIAAKSSSNGSDRGQDLVRSVQRVPGTASFLQDNLGSSVARGEVSRKDALSAAWWVDTQLRTLCETIQQFGSLNATTGLHEVTYGVLHKYASYLFRPLVGTLMTARKRGAIAFDGDMLFQGVHDNVVIRLVNQRIDDADESTYTLDQIRSCSISMSRRRRQQQRQERA